MIPLIKIRFTYLTRHKCSLVFCYLLIPSFLLLGLIIYASHKDSYPNILDGRKDFPYSYDQEGFDGNYDLKKILVNSSLVVNNEQEGSKLKNYINNKFQININYQTSENDISLEMPQTLILFNYDSDKDFYRFSLKFRKFDETSPFYDEDLSTQDAIDLFTYKFVINDNIYYHDNHSYKHKTQYYLLLQSFFADYLIQSKGKTSKLPKYFYGFNSYPPCSARKTDYFAASVSLSIMVALQFTLISISFNTQLLEEKDLKLENLLERYGIGKAKYIFSWFISYNIVSLFSNIVILVGAIVILECCIGLFIISLIFWNVAQFFLIYFISTIAPNKRSGLIINTLLFLQDNY